MNTEKFFDRYSKEKFEKKIDLLTDQLDIEEIIASFSTLPVPLKLQWLDSLILVSCKLGLVLSIFREELEQFPINLTGSFFYIGMNLPNCVDRINTLIDGLQFYSDARYIFMVTKQSKRINKYLSGNFNGFSDQTENSRVNALNILHYSVMYAPLVSLIAENTYYKILSEINIEIASTDEIELYVKILPIFTQYIQVPTASLIHLCSRLGNDGYFEFVKRLLSYGSNLIQPFEIIYYGIENLAFEHFCHYLGLELLILKHKTFDTDLIINLMDKILRTKLPIYPNFTFSINQLPDVHRIEIKKKLSDWVIQFNEDRSKFPELPLFISRFLKNEFEDFLILLKEWKNVIHLLNWFEILTNYLARIYETIEKNEDYRKEPEVKTFFKDLVEYLEDFLKEKKVDPEVIYGRGIEKNAFSKMMIIIWYMELLIETPLKIERIESNFNKYPVIRCYFGDDWVKNQLSQDDQTHILLHLLNTNDPHLRYLETILSDLNGEIDSEYQERFQDSFQFFDIISELSTLLFFKENNIKLQEREIKINNKKLDFLFSKDQQDLFVEVYNLRPYGPLRHLPSGWSTPNLIRDGILRKFKRKFKGLPKLNVSVIFAFDISEVSFNQQAIVEALKGSLGFKLERRDCRDVAVPVHINDSVFIKNPLINELSGILWIDKDLENYMSIIKYTEIKGETPEWFNELIKLFITPF